MPANFRLHFLYRDDPDRHACDSVSWVEFVENICADSPLIMPSVHIYTDGMGHGLAVFYDSVDDFKASVPLQMIEVYRPCLKEWVQLDASIIESLCQAFGIECIMHVE